MNQENSLTERLMRLDTSVMSDVLDEAGLPNRRGGNGPSPATSCSATSTASWSSRANPRFSHIRPAGGERPG
jgi:hypothetical protein